MDAGSSFEVSNLAGLLFLLGAPALVTWMLVRRGRASRRRILAAGVGAGMLAGAYVVGMVILSAPWPITGGSLLAWAVFLPFHGVIGAVVALAGLLLQYAAGWLSARP